MAPPKRKYKKRARRRNDPALLARFAAVRNMLRAVHARGASYVLMSAKLGVSRNALMRWCAPGHENLHMQTRLLKELEQWVASGCPIPGWSPKPEVALPTAEQLATSVERHKTLAGVHRNDFPTLSLRTLRRLLHAAGIHTTYDRRRHQPGHRFKTWVRRVETWNRVPPSYRERALLAGYITEDNKLTEAGIRFSLRKEDAIWLLGGQFHVAASPQHVSQTRLHPKCGRWLVLHGICRNETPTTLVLTEFGQQLRAELLAAATGIDGQ